MFIRASENKPAGGQTRSVSIDTTIKRACAPCEMIACTERAPWSAKERAAMVNVLPVSIMSSTMIATCAGEDSHEK
jgi:hypothetical protein